MSVTPHDYLAAADVVAAARELIRSEGDRCVLHIGQLLEELDELSDKFGDRFPVSPDMYKLVDLIERLWADPHIDQVPDTGCVEFAWNEAGANNEAPGRLLQQLLGNKTDRVAKE